MSDLKAYQGKEPLQLAMVGAGASGVEISIILKMLIEQNRWNAEVSLIHRMNSWFRQKIVAPRLVC